MKKIFILLSMLILSITLSSCKTWVPYNLEECESGYFKYHIYDEDGSNQTYVYLVGLTELGKQQKELIIPEYIDGLKVDGLGYERPVGGKLPIFGGMQAGDETVYFDGENSFHKFYFQSNFFIVSHRKVCLINCKNIDFIFWGYQFNIKDLQIKSYVWGYNKYDGYFNPDLYHMIANVSYMYNYENCPNDGYYWVDSYDNDLITFIPPNPEREGYIFDGWYKEEDCINKWDFSTDKTGEELIIEEKNQYNEYPGIYLYAKWIVG